MDYGAYFCGKCVFYERADTAATASARFLDGYGACADVRMAYRNLLEAPQMVN